MNMSGLGVEADLFLPVWATQIYLTNDPVGSAMAGGISDSLMRPQSFFRAYSDSGIRKGAAVAQGKMSGKASGEEERGDDTKQQKDGDR